MKRNLIRRLLLTLIAGVAVSVSADEPGLAETNEINQLKEAIAALEKTVTALQQKVFVLQETLTTDYELDGCEPPEFVSVGLTTVTPVAGPELQVSAVTVAVEPEKSLPPAPKVAAKPVAKPPATKPVSKPKTSSKPKSYSSSSSKSSRTSSSSKKSSSYSTGKTSSRSYSGRSSSRSSWNRSSRSYSSGSR